MPDSEKPETAPMHVRKISSLTFPGMGRMTLREMCSQYGLKQPRIVEVLATKENKTDPEKSLKEIASAHGTDPHELFALIHEAATRE